MPAPQAFNIAPQVPQTSQSNTTTPLGANAVWSSVIFSVESISQVVGSVFANQAGTLSIQQSYDQSNWDISSDYSIPISDGKGFQEDIVAPFLKVVYTNGPIAQTQFRLFFSFK